MVDCLILIILYCQLISCEVLLRGFCVSWAQVSLQSGLYLFPIVFLVTPLWCSFRISVHCIISSVIAHVLCGFAVFLWGRTYFFLSESRVEADKLPWFVPLWLGDCIKDAVLEKSSLAIGGSESAPALGLWGLISHYAMSAKSPESRELRLTLIPKEAAGVSLVSVLFSFLYLSISHFFSFVDSASSFRG